LIALKKADEMLDLDQNNIFKIFVSKKLKWTIAI